MSLQIVFVDGIGGRRFMRRPVFRELEAIGHQVHHFEYRASRESFTSTKTRLTQLLGHVSEIGAYAVIGYSFGGILARAVLTTSAPTFKRPCHLILLASPIEASRLCMPFQNWKLYRLLTGECGQIAAKAASMREIGLPAVRTTCIYGTQGIGLLGFVCFGRFEHDGMVTVHEISPECFSDAVPLNASHPFIATNRQALALIAERLAVSQEQYNANAYSIFNTDARTQNLT